MSHAFILGLYTQTLWLCKRVLVYETYLECQNNIYIRFDDNEMSG